MDDTLRDRPTDVIHLARNPQKNLLQFSGLTYGEGDEEVGRAKVEDKARGMQSAELKTACDLLGKEARWVGRVGVVVGFGVWRKAG